MNFNCPYCGQNLDADADLAGRPVKCPSCGNEILIPRPTQASGSSDGMKLCPYCSEPIKSAAIKCKHCGSMLSERPARAFQSSPPLTTNTFTRASRSEYPPPRPMEKDYGYAGFWIRAVAYIIDIFVMVIPVGLVSSFFTGDMPVLTEFDEASMAIYIGALVGYIMVESVIGSIMWWLYSAVCESSPWQGTVGKKVLGLQVADLSGQRISFGRATGRYFAKIISGMLLFIGYMMVGWTQKKQGLHDMMAGTLVLRK